MKIPRLIKYAAITLAGLALAFTTLRTQAQPSGSTVITAYTNTFDNNGNTTMYQNIGWMYWYSLYQDCFGAGYNLPMTNDPTMDADGNTNVSGSLYGYSPFAPRGTIPTGGTAAIPSYGEQNLLSGTFGGGQFDTSVVMEILTVTNISFKIHVLPGTVTDANGNFGSMEVGFKSVGYNADTQYYTNELTIPGAATNGWVLLQETNAQQFQNAAENSGDTYAQGVEFYYTQYNATSYPTNPVTFWIDDLEVHSSVKPPPPPPPPTLSISPASPGLNLFGSTGISINNREDIETTAGSYSWIGASGPVTYSFDISSYPIPDLDDFQCQIFLIPNPGTESAPDYTESNCIFLDLERTTNGGASCTFRYKTNEPNNNTMIYSTNIFGQPTVLAEIVNSNGAVGQWSLTFNDNTNVTMSGPGGITTNFNIPDGQFIVPSGGQTNVPAGTVIPAGSTSALFANDVFLYFGVQGNNVGGNGDHLVVTNFTVTGLGGADFSDNFISDAETYGSVNPSTWMTNAAYPACIQDVAPGNPYWIQWTQPASGFALQSTPTLLNPVWTLTTNNHTFVISTNYTQLISTNDFPGTNGFFALVQRTFSQLQVLLPGETAAPGTATGETGTVTPYSLSCGCDITVTVNADDAKWYLVPGITDSVTITTSDTGAGFATPPGTTANLVGGTVQFEMYFSTAGPQSVTVTDNTDTNIPPVTVPITVQ